MDRLFRKEENCPQPNLKQFRAKRSCKIEEHDTVQPSRNELMFPNFKNILKNVNSNYKDLYETRLHFSYLCPVTEDIHTSNYEHNETTHLCHTYSNNFLSGIIRAPKNIFPTVFAETSNTKISKDNEDNTMTKLLKSKPNIHRDEEVTEYIASQTGMDRVKALYGKTFDNQHHPHFTEMCAIFYTYGFGAFLVGIVFGGMKGKTKFVEKNKATKWDSNFKASRSAVDAMFLGGIKQGVIWALKLESFMIPFYLVSQSIATYRNETSPFEYAIGGAVPAAIININRGPKGMLASAAIGGFLGLLAGVVIYGSAKASGQTQSVRHYWYITDMLERKRTMEAQLKELDISKDL